MRWVHQYGPELNERIRKHLKSTNDSWRVDETYIKIKGEKMYLYRAIDSGGNTIDFYLSPKRDAMVAKRFLKKTLASYHATKPRSITADGDKAYPVAIRELKKEKCIPHSTPLRVKKYLNNIIEQDHRFIKNGFGICLIEIFANSYKNDCWSRGYACDQKGQTRQGRSLSKSKYILSMKSLV